MSPLNPSLLYFLIQYSLKSLYQISNGAQHPTALTQEQARSASKVSRETLETPPQPIMQLNGRLDILDIQTIEQISNRLMTYVTKTMEWNKKQNLTGAKTPQEFFLCHVFDCLAALARLQRQEDLPFESNFVKEIVQPPLQMSNKQFAAKSSSSTFHPYIIDVGTGAGLPGLVWACVCAYVYPELKILLIESLQKRVAFLKRVLSQLELSNVKIICGRFEELSKRSDFKELIQELIQASTHQTPIIVSRGTASPKNLWALIKASPIAFRAWYVFSSQATHKEFLTLHKSSVKKFLTDEFRDEFLVNSLSYPHIDASYLVQKIQKDASRKGLEEEVSTNLIQSVGQSNKGFALLTEIIPKS